MTYCIGTGKICFGSRVEANGAALRVNRRRRSKRYRQEAYLCSFCKLYHLGTRAK